MSDCGFHCYEIGGGFIAENPECPIHRDGGINDRLYALEAELAAERERADRSKAEGIKEGMRRAAEMCNAADKSTHPADLADAILKEAGE